MGQLPKINPDVEDLACVVHVTLFGSSYQNCQHPQWFILSLGAAAKSQIQCNLDLVNLRFSGYFAQDHFSIYHIKSFHLLILYNLLTVFQRQKVSLNQECTVSSNCCLLCIQSLSHFNLYSVKLLNRYYITSLLRQQVVILSSIVVRHFSLKVS